MITDDDSAEEAFRGGEEFLGKQLQPFSYLRQTAAEKLGMRFGSMTEDDIRSTPNPKFRQREKALLELEDKHKRIHAARKKKLLALVEEFKDEPEEVLTWAGMTQDAAIVLWTCSHPDSVVWRARRKPSEYERQIDSWAEKNGLAMGGENIAAALEIFAKLITAVTESKGNPDFGKDAVNEPPDPNE